ncbi:hypothetical protein [Longimicrobium sp.]
MANGTAAEPIVFTSMREPVNHVGAVAGTGTPWYASWTTFARN